MKSPLRVAIVGTLSGPVGAELVHIVEGAQSWLKRMNAKGGLNGHAVEAVVYDDGADPARHRAQVQEAVERKHVVAFFSEVGALTGSASVEYITAQRIPVVGGDTGSPHFYKSPLFFPQADNVPYLLHTFLLGAAEQAIPAGKKKLGILNCSEAQICDQSDRMWGAEAPKEGFQLVYRGRASIVQPDFTAECLSARNAGAEVMLVGMDTNSLQRLAASCARQGYRPVYAGTSATLAERLKDDPNLDGMLGTTATAPWFQTGTPASDEFQQAMRTFGVRPSPGAIIGWVSGKLLEKAGANLPEPPTSEAILRGLWSMRAEDLGGLTQPLTFVEGTPADFPECWFNVLVRDKAWVSPDAFQRHCHPRWRG